MDFQYRCSCSSSFGLDFNLFLTHIHQTNHMVACSCRLTFRSLERLAVHWQKAGHRGDARLSTPASKSHAFKFCEACHVLFANKTFLLQHQRETGHAQRPRCCVCRECIDDVDEHMETRHAPCPADGCYHVTKGAEWTELHQRNVGHCHCSECDLIFDCQQDFDIHVEKAEHWQLVDLDEEDKANAAALEMHHCDICNISFSNPDALTEHSNSRDHAAVFVAAYRFDANHKMNVHCEECDLTFNHVYILNKHTDTVHHRDTSPRKLYCPVAHPCDAFFERIPALLEHLQSDECRGMRLRPWSPAQLDESERRIDSPLAASSSRESTRTSSFSSYDYCVQDESEAEEDGGVLLPRTCASSTSSDESDGGVLLPRSRGSSMSSDGTDGILLLPVETDDISFDGLLVAADEETDVDTTSHTTAKQ